MNALTKDDLLYTQAAAALGMTQGSFSTLLRRKGFVGRRSPSHRYAKLISRAELEALIGYCLTDAQIEAAKSVTHARKNFPLIDNELNLDFGWIKFGWEICADTFLKHLLSHGINHIEPPPFPPELAAKVSERELFTRSEMSALLDSCVKQRDDQWWDWVNDSVQRAQFPLGPTTLDFKYPDTEEN